MYDHNTYDDNDYGKIICPYCFAKFEQEQVVFRATKAYNADELQLDDAEDMGGLLAGFSRPASDESDDRKLFLRFDMPDANGEPLPGQKIDEKLVKYWKERGGTAGYINQDKYWYHPHIDPADPETFRKMVKFEAVGGVQPDSDGFVRDEDGFVKRVFDLYSEAGQGTTMDRLCPECHNPLPLATYGKYNVKFIGVIGMTSAGKTVFLNQLVNNIATVIAGTDFIVGPDNLNEFGERIRRFAPLPSSTDSSIVRRPLAVDLLTKDPANRANSMTLVFYDIAGELCVNERGDKELAKAQASIGGHIAHSDALIFLIDPNQIPALAEEESRYSIGNVISVVSAIRSGVNVVANSGWDEVPVAICVAKSDKLRDHPAIPSGLPAFENPDFRIKDFDRDSNRQIHDFLRDMLKSSSPGVYAELTGFPQRAYFMLSAINCGVESRVEKYKNWYILDEINEKRYRNLKQWCEDWNKRTPEERAYFRRCPVKSENGDQISFPLDEKITDLNGERITTEVFGMTSYGDKLHLSVWDVASKLNLVGYPKGDPMYYRICEPVKWILWRMDEIGPRIEFEPAPRRAILEPNARYRMRYDAYLDRCEEQRKLFYWMDEDSV